MSNHLVEGGIKMPSQDQKKAKTINVNLTKEEYEKVHIDDKDIEYLHNTLERVISLLSSFTSVEDGKEDSMK